MPMNWTPANDQILFIALIQTHAISIDTSKIAKAWPEGEVKPTPRAIMERIHKIRKMTEGKMATTPVKSRAKVSVSTPTSSAKKRKTADRKIDVEDNESDTEGHKTPIPEHITPKSRKTNTGRRGTADELPKTPSGDVDWVKIAARKGLDTPSKKPFIKQESSADDSFETRSFSRDVQRARNPSVQGPVLESNYAVGNYDMPTPISAPHSSIGNSPGNMDGHYDDMAFTSFGMDMVGMSGMDAMGLNTIAMDVNMNVAAGDDLGHSGMVEYTFNTPIQSSENLLQEAQRLNLSPSRSFVRTNFSNTTPTPKKALNPAKNDVFSVGSSHASISAVGPGSRRVGTQTPVPERRTRTPRKASQGVQEYIKNQKEEEKALGERTSDEDSAESEFQESDDEV